MSKLLDKLKMRGGCVGLEIEAVNNRERLRIRAVSILLHKLATADSDDVAEIAKELRQWYKKMPNRGFGLHRKK